LYKKIIFNEPDYTRSLTVKVSNEAKDLINKLLDKNQKTRLKICELKSHKFFEGLDFEGVYYKNKTAPFIPDSVYLFNLERY
jgi:hypothetical protein